MTDCRFMSDMWIHRKTALEVTCVVENLKVVLMWDERCAYNVIELVDTSCFAVCIGSESILPCICLPLAADRYRCVCSVMWNMLELPRFGRSGNMVCKAVSLWCPPPFSSLLSHLMHTRFAAVFHLFHLVTMLCEVLMKWHVVRWSWKSVMTSVRTNVYMQVYLLFLVEICIGSRQSSWCV